MAELQDAGSDVAYRPLSGLALIGFVVSCLFGGVVAVNALLAIWQGAPVYFENWTLLIAGVGFLVSWVGHNVVRSSEGTKAGQKLATWGMWISLVSGTGYFAYSYFTGLALAQQTQAFFWNEDDESGFFTHLQKARTGPTELERKIALNRAFLLTMPYPMRKGIRPDDDKAMRDNFDPPGQGGAPSMLARFHLNPLVTSISRSHADVVIEALGVQDWKYDKRSYHVSCMFRIKNDEATMNMVLTARTSEGEVPGQGRQWFVDVTAIRGDPPIPTPLGAGLTRLREQVSNQFGQLETTLRDKKKAAALPNFAQLDQTDWTQFEPFVQQELKPRLQEIFRGAMADATWHINPSMDKSPLAWERDDQGRLTFAVPFSIMMANQKRAMDSAMDGTAFYRTQTAVDPAQIAGADGATIMPEWELKHVKLHRLSKKKT